MRWLIFGDDIIDFQFFNLFDFLMEWGDDDEDGCEGEVGEG